eukprot:354414-Chlamydomonas_euryale.AAC.3
MQLACTHAPALAPGACPTTPRSPPARGPPFPAAPSRPALCSRCQQATAPEVWTCRSVHDPASTGLHVVPRLARLVPPWGAADAAEAATFYSLAALPGLKGTSSRSRALKAARPGRIGRAAARRGPGHASRADPPAGRVREAAADEAAAGSRCEQPTGCLLLLVRCRSHNPRGVTDRHTRHSARFRQGETHERPSLLSASRL